MRLILLITGITILMSCNEDQSRTAKASMGERGPDSVLSPEIRPIANHQVGRVRYAVGIPAYQEEESDSTIRGGLYLVFRMEYPGSKGDLIKTASESEEEYYMKLHHCSFQSTDDFTLLDNQTGMVHSCVLCHFERAYNLNATLTFNLYFDVEPSHHHYTLVYIDRIFGNGPVKMQLPVTGMS